METIDIITAIPIAILYPYFMNKLSDVTFNSSDINKKEEELNKTNYRILADENDPDAFLINKRELRNTYSKNFFFASIIDKDCADNKKECVFVKENPQIDIIKNDIDKARRLFDNKKFIFLLIAGVIGVIMSTMYIQKIKGVALGINIGSIITMCYATYVNWRNFNELSKLVISALGLLMLIYSGIRLRK